MSPRWVVTFLALALVASSAATATAILKPAATVTVTRTIQAPPRVITRIVIRKVPGPTVTVTTGIPVTCGQQLWQAWANRAPVAADMLNVAPSVIPACMPDLSEIDGG